MQRAKAKAKHEWKEAQLKLKRKREELFDVKALEDFRNTTLMAPITVYGDGHKNGGTKQQHQKERLNVLDRLRQLAPHLGTQAIQDYAILKKTWDDWGWKENVERWPKIFCQKIQTVADAIKAGETNAFEKFLYSELNACSLGRQALCLPKPK